jgi:hypothetical protein
MSIIFLEHGKVDMVTALAILEISAIQSVGICLANDTLRARISLFSLRSLGKQWVYGFWKRKNNILFLCFLL